MEVYFIHPQSYLVLWSKSAKVFGLQKKNTGVTVFNIFSIEPVLDSYQSQFLVTFRYTIDQEETMEMKTTCDLLSPKIKKGNNTITVEQGGHSLAITFCYQGYNEENNAFGLQNLSFTLFSKPIKVHRHPSSRPYSMDFGVKSLKINSHSYKPASKATSSMTLNTFNVISSNKDSQDLKKIAFNKSNRVKDKILKKTPEELCDVIKDSNGNYIVQEVFKLCSPEERILIMSKIKENIVELSCHKKGTHSMQTLVVELKSEVEVNTFLDMLADPTDSTALEPEVRKVNEDEHEEAFDENKGPLYSLSSNSYGTFVLQKVVDHFPEDLLSPIYQFCVDHFEHMSTNKNGLPIIKKALVKFQSGKQAFISIIENMTMFLAQHPFGNYSLQVAIDSWRQEDCSNIIVTVLDNLQKLSMQKFSSNVVEK
mmetsp:Transcript_12035/g.12055  ORF Transcript_12035/g.12055 Transcript_12035/m.12055 type:complete len:424 (+) Transcript_12035:191-1462(+)